MSPPVIHQFVRGPNAARAALAAAAAFLAERALGACPSLALVVEELVLNLVDHGAGGDPLIEMGVSCDATHIRLTLTDGGAPFDPRLAPAPGELPPERGGGAGLALVRAFSQIEFYTRVDGRNHLQLAIPLGDH